MTKKSISIIIPVYNVEQYIKECILSIINQTYTTGLECIVVDDCGKDNSIKVVEELLEGYSGDIKFSIIKHGNNKGLSAARNTGLYAAEGDYVMFVDSDDKISEDCVEKIVMPLSQYDYDMIVPNFITIGGADDKFAKCLETDFAVYGRQNIAKTRLDAIWYVMAWAKLYRKNFLLDNKIEFCEGIIHEDELFSAEIACVMESMYILGSVYAYVYRLRDNSITSSLIFQRRKDSYMKILSHMGDFMNRHDLFKQISSNELYMSQFYTACRISRRVSEEVLFATYSEYRKVFKMRIWQLFPRGKSLKQFIRDLHFLLPPYMGKFLAGYYLKSRI